MCGCNCNDFVMNIGATGPQGPVGPTGPKGDPGSTIYYTTNDSLVGVSQTPSSSPINGDWLLVQTTGNWYRRESNAWVLKYKSSWTNFVKNTPRLILTSGNTLQFDDYTNFMAKYRIINNLLTVQVAYYGSPITLSNQVAYGIAFNINEVYENYLSGGVLYTSGRMLSMCQYRKESFGSPTPVERLTCDTFIVGNEGSMVTSGFYNGVKMLSDASYFFSQPTWSDWLIIRFQEFGSLNSALGSPNGLSRTFAPGDVSNAQLSFNVMLQTQIEMA